MRYLLALLLVAISLPCYALNTAYYVNPSNATARNLPLASGYGLSPTDSPWISPSYAIAQITGNNDTLFIYPGNPGSDSYYYGDYVDFSSDVVSFVGVSVSGDSPTFSRRAPAENTAWLYRSASAAAYDNQTISGLRFTNSNAQYNGIAIFTASYKNTIVRDCIFDSISFTGTYGIGEGCITFTNYTTSDTGYVYNNSFINLKNVAPVKVQTQNAATVSRVSISNNSVRNSTWFMNNSLTNTNQTQYIIVKDNIIDSVGYLSYNCWSSGTGITSNISYLNNDTYNVVFSGLATDANITMNHSFSSNYNVDPQWRYASTDALARFNYLQDTAPASVTSGSSSVGLLGALWGWAAATPTPTTTLQYLYRGMNIMQRFDIIRRR